MGRGGHLRHRGGGQLGEIGPIGLKQDLCVGVCVVGVLILSLSSLSYCLLLPNLG